MVKGEGKIRENKVTGEFEIIREGKENRERIFEFIRTNKDRGARPCDIIRSTGLSKEAVHNHLQVLLSNKRIYKKDHRYYPEISILNEFLDFSLLMRDKAYLLIDKELMESAPDADMPYDLGNCARLKLHQKIKIELPEKISSFRDVVNIPSTTPDATDHFIKMILGPIVSEKYCNQHFESKESVQRSLFEFSNRIGAYITYIFLQAMYPLQDSKLDSKDRSELASTMIDKSIVLNDFFEGFRYLMTQLGLTNLDLESNEYMKLYELPVKSFVSLSNGIKSIYPNLYIGFENWWFHATSYWLEVYNIMNKDKSSACIHEWEETYRFKYPSVYVCRKCHSTCNKLSKKKNN